MVEAQAPQPRFGYGSVPRGAYVIPAPKAAPKPATAAKPKATPVATKPKPKVAAASPKATAKPTASKAAAKPKTVIAKSPAKMPPPKPETTKAPQKAIASNKAKTVKPEAKPAVKTQLAKATPPVRRSTTKPVERPAAKPALIARSSPSGPSDPRKADLETSPAPAPMTRSMGLADVGHDAAQGGFHFFGVPVVLPDVSASSAPVPTPATDGKHFVDIMAARHSLNQRPAFQPSRSFHHSKFKPAPESSPTAKTAPVAAFVAATPSTGPRSIPTPAAPPEIEPQKIASTDFHNADPIHGAGGKVELLEEPVLSRTVPATLSLKSTPTAPEAAPESVLLDEPALPAPVISVTEAPPVAESPPELEPPLPREALSAPAVTESVMADEPAAAPAHQGDENDLSARERAFVRSLAEAAGSVTSASGKLNTDLPASIPTAASALMNQIPAETVSTFRSVAATAKQTARDLVPDLPMEISNDLMPATPEKMPDRLPSFNAPASGKIDVQSDRQADYDQANNKVIFTGKVELNSAAMRLRAERVEVFMKKGGGGMERVEASGNVLMRTQDTESGPGQMASAGRASYNLKTGEITLSDWPKIQETGKSHISTDPGTKMYMFTDGRLRTDGPNRTIIGGN